MKSARTYIDAARRVEGENPKHASVLYLKAASEYIDAKSHCSDPNMIDIIKDDIEHCKGKAESLKNYSLSPKRRRIAEGGDGGKYENTRSFLTEVPKETFDDVAGMYDAKIKLEKAIMWPLIYPEKYPKFVGKSSQGILLYGPPGCGKTYIAKAVVGEANKKCNQKISFIYARSSDILDSWVGNSEKNIRAAFQAAAESSPSILFFDELDGMGRTRSGKSVYADRLVNEFLTSFEMLKDKTTLVVGATNFPWRVDPALIRSGRIGRKILVEAPDYEARLELFKIYTKNKEISNNINFDELATYTKNYSASDIEQICEDAGLYALEDGGLKDDGRKIEYTDFLKAIKDNKTSLYNWCDEAAKQLKKREVNKEFSDLIKVIEKVVS